ncbi:lysylphosphatidylglycerol synthase domain-containing protein [Balneolales bacterium ANBcel1]|nr:lysylphosphatidylglycerol synthase domain-containing protein [Balneolales bacterium ANBcel1]
MSTPVIKRIFRRRNILPVIGISLFLAALWILQGEIQQFSWQTFRSHVELIPVSRLMMAAAATVTGYVILTFYDKLALVNLGIRLPWRKLAKASFLGFAFSHNITPSLLVGGTMRYRIYSGLGVSGFNVTRVVGFCAMTLWIGFMALGGTIFTFTSISLPGTISWPLPNLQVVGWIFLGLTLAYLVLCRTVRATIAFRGKLFSLPELPVAIGQIVVSSADLIASSLILYLLLPPIPELSYPLFLAIYLLGFMGGIISQVPGGLGVIETILVLMLGSFIESGQILSAVLVFRLFYFIVPLLIAATVLGIHEVRQRRKANRAGRSS